MGSNGMPVWSNLQKARVSLERADAELRALDVATRYLHGLGRRCKGEAEAARLYTNFLAHASMVGVCVDAAGKAAGRPPDFASWWESLKAHETHAFFRHERNRALKQVSSDVIVSTPVHVSEHERMAYWALPSGPHTSEPLVPRCQKYTDWLYYELIAPAEVLLFEWTVAEREAAPFTLFD